MKKTLLGIRAGFISVYKNNEVIINILSKFILTFICLLCLNNVINFSNSNIVTIVLCVALSLISMGLPTYITFIALMIITLIKVSQSGLILTIVMISLALLFYILYIRLFKKETLLIIFTLLLLPTGAIYLVPLVGALFFGFGAFGAFIVGCSLYNILMILPLLMNSSASITLEEVDTIFAQIEIVTNKILSVTVYDQNMLATASILMVVFLVVYLIRILSIDYAPYIAIFFGSVINILGFLLADLLIQMNINIPMMIITTLICMLFAFFVSFLSRVLDYNRAQVVQFEDEHNYYFVKVIPKIELSSRHNEIYDLYDNIDVADEEIIIEI
ncbi:hypothetical protein [Candidatus Epulonipiscium viviparus]|uniref:hypothetical protein n=1 Tax=Candidatus Epulonipiscium viviparus TaxID=420336 RepID=UPI00016BFF0E|nr:hypothetical protein [Candidatus Epulopiscium viviparus]